MPAGIRVAIKRKPQAADRSLHVSCSPFFWPFLSWQFYPGVDAFQLSLDVSLFGVSLHDIIAIKAAIAVSSA